MYIQSNFHALQNLLKSSIFRIHLKICISSSVVYLFMEISSVQITGTFQPVAILLGTQQVCFQHFKVSDNESILANRIARIFSSCFHYLRMKDFLKLPEEAKGSTCHTLLFCLTQHATDKAQTLDAAFEKGVRSKSCPQLREQTFLWVTASGRGMATAAGVYVHTHTVCQLTSGTVFSWVNWCAPDNIWACLGHSRGKGIVSIAHLNEGTSEIHLNTCCAAPAVIHQCCAQFSWLLKLPRDDSPLLQSQLEFKMSLMCLRIFAKQLFVFTLTLLRGEKNLLKKNA